MDSREARCLSDISVDNRSTASDPSTQNTTDLSEESQNSTGTFKKYPWLAKYFKHELKNNIKLITCLSCNCLFRSRSCQRLIGHFNRCKELMVSEVQELPVIMENANAIKTNLWTDVMIENGISLKAVESKSFKKWVASCIPSWKVPPRQEFSQIYIPQKSHLSYVEFMRLLENGHLLYLSIEFDHWLDKVGRSFLGVIATTGKGDKYLLDLRDVSLKGHFTDVIVEELMDVLQSIPNKAINSFVSDSASSCKKARQDIIKKERYEHSIQHRCLAHLVNLIGSKITTNNESISTSIGAASKITGLVSCSPFWLAHIKRLNLRKTHSACPVRWYSTVNMIASLIELKSVIVEDILPTLIGDKAEIVENLDWEHLGEILEVLQPLNHCIGTIEKRDITLGEAFDGILHYAKQLFDSNEYSGTLIEARKSFLWYMNCDYIGREEFALYMAAYALDSRFRLRYITEDGIDLAMEAIIRVGLKSDISMKRIQACLYEDFECYRCGDEGYNTCEGEKDQVKWWNGRLNSGSMLARVAIRLAHLKASSANMERTFSTIKGIQGTSRLNFLPSTLVDITRLKILSHETLGEDELDDLDQTSLLSDDQPSPDSSLNSSESSQADVSTITDFQDLPNWLEDQEIKTKRCYQAFFQYIDFSATDSGVDRSRATKKRISEEQINQFVQSARELRRNKKSRVTYDTQSQIDDCEAIFIDSDTENTNNQP